MPAKWPKNRSACVWFIADANLPVREPPQGDWMPKAFLFGFAALAVTAVASGAQAQAKGQQCHDSRGQAVPCAQKNAPAPTPAPSDGASGGAGGGCLWLMVNGSLVPCYIQ